MLKRPPLVLGGALVAALIGLSSLAWRDDSGVVQREGGRAAQRGEHLFLVLLVCAFLVYVLAVLLFRNGGPDPVGDRCRRARSGHPTWGTAPSLDRRLDVLGLRLDRASRGGEPVHRPAERLPPEPGRGDAGRCVERYDHRLRTGVYGCFGRRRGSLRGFERSGGVDLQGSGGRRHLRGGPARRSGGASPRSRAGRRGLEPGSRSASRRRWSQRRVARRTPDGSTRARGRRSRAR